MKHYVYTKHTAKTWPHVEHEVVFACEAPDLLAADKLLLAATGIDAEKATNISCAA